jgi:hypothetical protein
MIAFMAEGQNAITAIRRSLIDRSQTVQAAVQQIVGTNPSQDAMFESLLRVALGTSIIAALLISDEKIAALLIETDAQLMEPT